MGIIFHGGYLKELSLPARPGMGSNNPSLPPFFPRVGLLGLLSNHNALGNEVFNLTACFDKIETSDMENINGGIFWQANSSEM